MEAPSRKRGRPPKHPKVQASNDSPKNALLQAHSNNYHPPTLNSPSSPAADVEMVDRVMPPLVDSRPSWMPLLDKVDGPSSVMPGPDGGGSPSDRDLSKSEADIDDVDSPPERFYSKRNKKSALANPGWFPNDTIRGLAPMFDDAPSQKEVSTKAVYFKTESGPRVGVLVRDGKIDYSALGDQFELDPTSIQLNELLCSREAVWEEIEKFFKNEGEPVGTKENPVIVTGKPRVHGASTGDASPFVELVRELKQELVRELRSEFTSSSSWMASTSIADKGHLVKASTMRLDLPPPLIDKEADEMWPIGSWMSRAKVSVEDDFKKLLKELNYASSPFNLVFTGNSSSVCGGIIKPDAVIYKRPQLPGTALVALTTGAILDLKSGKDGLYNNDQRVGKAINCGEKMLETLRGFRSSVIVGVTDLEKVQWFRVIRTDKNKFQYGVGPELNDVRGSLCALLKSSFIDLGLLPPSLTVDGVEHELISFLGAGATSSVFYVKDGDGREYVAKVPFSHTGRLLNDQQMLDALKDVEGVPKVLGWFEDGNSLKIHPVGRPLTHKHLSSWLRMVPGLVDVLQKAHDLGIINRDVRPQNIMIAEGKSKKSDMLYILDWGYVVAKNKASAFSGGVLYASKRILTLLADGAYKVVAEGQDDLEALVHTIFSLKFREKHMMLRDLEKTDFAKLQRFWSKCFDEIPAWNSALMAARAEDYEKLKSEFEQFISNSCLL